MKVCRKVSFKNVFGKMNIEPPNDNYPDCECLVALTTQHLYVLEDNYDGTYETHFEFVLSQIDDIKNVQEKMISIQIIRLYRQSVW